MEPQPLGEPQRPGSGSPLLDRRGSGDQMNAFGSVQNINHGNGGQVLYNFITNNSMSWPFVHVSFY